MNPVGSSQLFLYIFIYILSDECTEKYTMTKVSDKKMSVFTFILYYDCVYDIITLQFFVYIPGARRYLPQIQLSHAFI